MSRFRIVVIPDGISELIVLRKGSPRKSIPRAQVEHELNEDQLQPLPSVSVALERLIFNFLVTNLRH